MYVAWASSRFEWQRGQTGDDGVRGIGEFKSYSQINHPKYPELILPLPIIISSTPASPRVCMCTPYIYHSRKDGKHIT
ncbi:hypothetical protein VTJ04DRAFT_10275 [Mycothermus thermophilus]|uniref:uncharacterized protein n=1 Tax=Humicola insolens TaxID=85995 RepID=UPI003742D7B7